MCLLQLEPEMIALSEEMAHDEYKPSSLKFFSDVAVVSNFPVCQVSTTPMQHMPIDIQLLCIGNVHYRVSGNTMHMSVLLCAIYATQVV